MKVFKDFNLCEEDQPVNFHEKGVVFIGCKHESGKIEALIIKKH